MLADAVTLYSHDRGELPRDGRTGPKEHAQQWFEVGINITELVKEYSLPKCFMDLSSRLAAVGSWTSVDTHADSVCASRRARTLVRSSRAEASGSANMSLGRPWSSC